jgi:hypothetical protein
MSQDNIPRFTRSSVQRSASLPSGGLDDTQRSLSPPASRRGETRSTPSHRTTRPEELAGGVQFTTPRSMNVTPMTAAIVPPPIPPRDANRFGDLAATTVDESDPEDTTDDATTLSEPLISPRPDNVDTYPDTPTLNCNLDSCIVDITNDLATAPDRDWTAQFDSLRKDLRMDMANTLALLQQSMTDNTLALLQQSMTDLDNKINKKISLLDQDMRQTVRQTVTNELNNIVKAELDDKLGSVKELDVKLVSVRDDITSRLDSMSATIAKLSREVNVTSSNLGHVTKTTIPDLEKPVDDICNENAPQPPVPPDDIPTPPAPSTPTDPPPRLAPTNSSRPDISIDGPVTYPHQLSPSRLPTPQ